MTEGVFGLERDEGTSRRPSEGEPVNAIGAKKITGIERVGSRREEARGPGIWGEVKPFSNDGVGILGILCWMG